MTVSTALLTDHYELTMLQAALRSGEARRRCVFEAFARRLPDGRRYGVLGGTGRFLEALETFRFGDDELRFLRDTRVVDAETVAWLEGYRFSGQVSGYAEGECYFPGSPVLVVESSFAEGVVLETLALSILNHDTAIASAASRMTSAAGDRPCIEMGSRRTHEEAAVAAARAAYVAGFEATSNLEAGRRHGVPTTGTAAHAFTLLYDSEREAFTAQVESLGRGTTLLVDTYDVRTAVDLALEIAGPELGAVRLDSGDLLIQATEVRHQLDAAGNHDTKIIVTSDLDEYAIAGLAAGPVSGYGVGTALVTGSGAPTASMVYKLVQREDASGRLAPVAKKSKDKTSVGGRKWALRRRSPEGVAQAEVIGIGEHPVDDGDDRPLMVELVRDGDVVDHQDIHEARARHAASRDELPRAARQLSRGEPVIPTVYEQEHA
ncbi:nicotinate phosphoribosyltransferase [Terracoccus luteus]|jgi:nicotinate phosphoribosyltransferase|uniref:Nicotinate phosphoribosyltransferase n=1 Tax=Terracoccus luteus TaxID=53356 RepID=A0A495XW02_9MICO|nr:nicotinate phosphoribosyltransferase [Terracoccus luteus]RKT76994.1 nicotinate phosphoribosyltransferase [Terracoccus luteus]